MILILLAETRRIDPINGDKTDSLFYRWEGKKRKKGERERTSEKERKVQCEMEGPICPNVCIEGYRIE